MREGEIIARFLAPLSGGEPGSFSLTDDAAVLTPSRDAQLVVTTDSVIEGVHVLPGATPQQFAEKLVRRNLSDLAAMGATPWRYFLNLHIPRTVDAAWLQRFADTLRTEQERFGMVLAGGDTTIGGDGVHLTLTALGLLDGAPLTRAGARPGDALFVSGTIGDAALGLAMLQSNRAAQGYWIERYHRPEPRLSLGAALRGKASAALDCSDGLLKDLARLCTASRVGVTLELEKIPVSNDTAGLLANAPDALARLAIRQTLVTGGDDYELIFTAPPALAEDIHQIAKFRQVRVTAIGTITEDAVLCYRDETGLHPFSSDAGWEY